MPFVPLTDGPKVILTFFAGRRAGVAFTSATFLFRDRPLLPWTGTDLSSGGEDEDPSRNLRAGILGFFASSSLRLQSPHIK